MAGLGAIYKSQYSTYTTDAYITLRQIDADGMVNGTEIALRNPEIDISYDAFEPANLTISGILQTGEPGRRIYPPPHQRKQEKNTVFPGALTIADANGNALTITPTGTNGYTVHTEGEPVRVNSKMNDTIREHTVRCLNYNKPKPPAELEA